MNAMVLNRSNRLSLVLIGFLCKRCPARHEQRWSSNCLVTSVYVRHIVFLAIYRLNETDSFSEWDEAWGEVLSILWYFSSEQIQKLLFNHLLLNFFQDTWFRWCAAVILRSVLALVVIQILIWNAFQVNLSLKEWIHSATNPLQIPRLISLRYYILVTR